MGDGIENISASSIDEKAPNFILGKAGARYAIATLKSRILATLRQPGNFISLHNETMLGVDITPSCIYVCQVDNKGGNCALTSLASVCMEGKFVGEDILNNPDLYSEYLKELIRKIR